MHLKPFKRWLRFLLPAVLILAAAVYIFRRQLEHAIFAYEIRQARIFAGPPPPAAGESRLHQRRVNAQFYWDLAGLCIDPKSLNFSIALAPFAFNFGLWTLYLPALCPDRFFAE